MECVAICWHNNSQVHISNNFKGPIGTSGHPLVTNVYEHAIAMNNGAGEGQRSTLPTVSQFVSLVSFSISYIALTTLHHII